MEQYKVEASQIIAAPAEQVYAVIADYHEGHQAILPRRYFKEMIVTEGGYGEGTAITLHMDVFGTKTTYHQQVTEPEPGRLLVEEDREAGVSTSFTVDPIQEGQTKVTICTTMPVKPGLRGKIERFITPPFMRKIYREELQKLSEVASSVEKQ